MRKDDPSTTSKGASFEVQVMSLYEGLGYKVERNLNIGGQQVDLLVSRFVPGMGHIKSVIECKYLSGSVVSNQMVHEFASYLRGVRDLHGITSGVLVTNRDFSTDAKLAAGPQHFIQLRKLSDLQKELFDVSQILIHRVNSFAVSEEYRQYVSLSGFGRRPGAQEEQHVEDVLQELADWVAAANGGLVTILGDFGSGKTTLLRRLQHLLEARIAQGEQARLPVFFPLRARTSHSDLNAFIIDTISREFEGRVPPKVFFQQLEAGRFLLLLDGFDELAISATAKQRADSFLDLAPLLTSPSPSIMSCRPTYFVSTKEYNDLITRIGSRTRKLIGGDLVPLPISERTLRKYVNLPAYQKISENVSGEIELKLFDESKIDEYLQHREPEFLHSIGAPWKKVREFLYSVYDLRDLMTRPILLSLIADTVIDGHVKLGDKKLISGPAGLYETYTGVQLQRDSSLGESRRYLTPHQRRDFAQAMALAMLAQQELAVSYGAIVAILDNWDKSLGAHLDRESVITDVLVCAFLSRQPDGYFRFVHKSFMEFFVAQYLKFGIEKNLSRLPQILENSLIRLFSLPLSTEIMRFFVNYQYIEKSLPQNVARALSLLVADRDALANERDFSLALRNVNLVALLMCESMDRCSFMRGEFREMQLSEKSLALHSFSECTFSSFSLSRCKLSELSITKSNFELTTVWDSQWSNCTVRSVLRNTSINKGKLADCRFFIHCYDAKWQELTLDGCALALEGSLTLQSCNLSDTSIRTAGVGEVERAAERDAVRKPGNRKPAARKKQNLFARGKSEEAGNRRLSLELMDSSLTRCSIVPDMSADSFGVRIRHCKMTDCFVIQAGVDAARLGEAFDLLRQGNTTGFVHIRRGSISRAEGNVETRIHRLAPDLAVLVHGLAEPSRPHVTRVFRKDPMIFTEPRHQELWDNYLASLEGDPDGFM